MEDPLSYVTDNQWFFHHSLIMAFGSLVIFPFASLDTVRLVYVCGTVAQSPVSSAKCSPCLGSSKPLWLLLTTQWLTTRSSHSHGGCLKPGTFPQNPRGNKTGKSWEINFVCSSDWKGLQNSSKIQIYNIQAKHFRNTVSPIDIEVLQNKNVLKMKWNKIFRNTATSSPVDIKVLQSKTFS